MGTSRSLALCWVGSWVACGCGGGTAASSQPPTPEGGVTVSPADDAAAGEGGTIAFEFLDISGGNVPVTEALYGDAIDVRMTGLVPGSAVEIHARNVGDDGQGYEAYATFTADRDGTVDVATTAPSSGTYSGVDPDGLVWSGELKPEPGDASAWSGQNAAALFFSALVGGSTVASATFPRFGIADGVTSTSVTANGLVGEFRMPTFAGTRGAVIAFGGSEGGISAGEWLADYYASQGYPALGLAYFGAAGLPSSLSGVPLEYFQTAYNWLSSQSGIDASKIVVVGGSRGGELALLLGATFPWVTGVVAQCPSGVLWPDDAYGTAGWNTAAWTYKGQPLPFIPFTNGTPSTVTLANGATATTVLPVYQAGFDDASSSQLAAATTNVEATGGPVLLQAAADDEMWMSCSLSQIAMSRLTQSGHAAAHGDQLTCYPGAGHNIFNFGAPTASELSSTDPAAGSYVYALGGTPEGIGHAERAADSQVRAFLAANLK